MPLVRVGRFKLIENARAPFIGGEYTGEHYNTVCQNDPDTCNSWRFHAFAQFAVVVVLAATAWTYNERRAIKS